MAPSEEQLEIFEWLFNHAVNTEWMTAHAAEDQYCPYCCTEEDAWKSMDKHREGCKYKEMIEKARQMKANLVVSYVGHLVR